MKITPVLLVDSIENSLPFWTDRMGFTKIAEVPEGERLGFVILIREETELMLQTFDSARRDLPELVADSNSQRSSLFIEVNDWPDTLARLRGYPITVPERETFYGMREIGLFEPNGHAILFAFPQQKAK